MLQYETQPSVFNCWLSVCAGRARSRGERRGNIGRHTRTRNRVSAIRAIEVLRM